MLDSSVANILSKIMSAAVPIGGLTGIKRKRESKKPAWLIDDENVISSSYPHSKSKSHILFKKNVSICRDRGHACAIECLQADATTLEDWDLLVDFLTGKETQESCQWKPRLAQLLLPFPLNSKFDLYRCQGDEVLEMPKLLFLFAVDMTSHNFLLAIKAGFFLFAQSTDFLPPDPSRGVVSIELAGEREYACSDDDHGGRIVLTDIHNLIIGKKTTRSVRDANDEKSINSTCLSSTPFRLEVSFSSEVGAEIWQKCVETRGIDWMGFNSIRDLYMKLWFDESQIRSDVKFLTICLFDDITGKLVSAEIGYIIGCIYSCISHVTDSSSPEYSRADRIRSNAGTLWLSRAGIQMFDVGTTAQYYVDMSGYRRTTRTEFVDLWRLYRDASLDSAALLNILKPCREIKSMFVNHRNHK